MAYRIISILIILIEAGIILHQDIAFHSRGEKLTEKQEIQEWNRRVIISILIPAFTAFSMAYWVVTRLT